MHVLAAASPAQPNDEDSRAANAASAASTAPDSESAQTYDDWQLDEQDWAEVARELNAAQCGGNTDHATMVRNLERCMNCKS